MTVRGRSDPTMPSRFAFERRITLYSLTLVVILRGRAIWRSLSASIWLWLSDIAAETVRAHGKLFVSSSPAAIRRLRHRPDVQANFSRCGPPLQKRFIGDVE